MSAIERLKAASDDKPANGLCQVAPGDVIEVAESVKTAGMSDEKTLPIQGIPRAKKSRKSVVVDLLKGGIGAGNAPTFFVHAGDLQVLVAAATPEPPTVAEDPTPFIPIGPTFPAPVELPDPKAVAETRG